MRFLMMIMVVGAMVYLLWYFTRRASWPVPPLLRELNAAGIKPGESEKLLAKGGQWQAQRTLMTERDGLSAPLRRSP